LMTIAGGGHDNHLSETNLAVIQTFIQKASQK
jgi:hypothetical protein